MSGRRTKPQKNGLGKALQNRIDKKRMIHNGDRAPIFFQQTQQNQAEIKKMKMKSIIDQNSLSQFLQIAQMSQTNYQANRDIKFSQIREQIRNKKIVITNKKTHYYMEQSASQQILHGLQLPRRPDWHTIKSKEQLQKTETEAYLNWRRKLADIEEKNPQIHVTPYEKNIEVWRQLWRVAERSDLIVQIVDGRDPMFFRCDDLVEYAKQLNKQKRHLLLINKSDLVSIDIRQRWNKYFTQLNIDHIFFTAKPQTIQMQQEQSEYTKQESENQQITTKEKYLNKTQILKVSQLNQLLHDYIRIIAKEKIQVGLVGYPNVGKSSIINALLGKKKVGVASMPGKTKHFQTLNLSDKLMLCDCPGLVFPRISSTFAQMILNGLYPVDTMKKHQQAFQIMTLRIPSKAMTEMYGIHWKEEEPYNAETLLNKYSQLKGFFTGSGLPNQSVAARHIMKDYVNGMLIYAKNPPGYKQVVDEHAQGKDNTNTHPKGQMIEVVEHTKNLKKMEENTEKELDGEFFEKVERQDEADEETILMLTQEDLLDIVEGRKIAGMKITKQMRKYIKFALKRGDTLDIIKKHLLQGAKEGHKLKIKV